MNESLVALNSTINQTINETVSQIPQVMGFSLPITFSPAVDIAIMALVGSLFITLVNKFFSDQVKIRALKDEMKELKKQSRKYMIKDPKKAQQLQQEMMRKSMENIKHTMNPKILLITLIPMLLLFTLARTFYHPFGDILNLGFTQFGWFGTYFVFSIIWSLTLKKVLDVA